MSNNENLIISTFGLEERYSISGNVYSNIQDETVNISNANVAIQGNGMWSIQKCDDKRSYKFGNTSDYDGLQYGNYTVTAFKYIPSEKKYLFGTTNVSLKNIQDVSNVDIKLSWANESDEKVIESFLPYLGSQEISDSPIANLSANLTEGYAPLAVQFTDLSQNVISRKWDFNNDGITDSNDINPIYIYTTPGKYTVNLTVSNGNGTTSETAIINVLQLSDRDSSSSEGGDYNSGGGGGAGGSSEPQSNVETKELSQTFISSGNSVKFDFPQKVTPVLSIILDSKKAAGKTTTIVEVLKEKSTLVSGLPPGEIYKCVNIWVGNGGFGDSSNIANAVINFKVEKAWMRDKSIDKSSITLNRYSNKKWDSLPTNLSDEDDRYLYFTAKTPGFSPFTITGKTTVTGNAVLPITGNKTPSVVDDTQNNDGNTTAKVDQLSKRTQGSNASGKEGTQIPGFEIASSITCLLGVFLYKRR
jgi:PGF-pre-PGF domain-containing protein